MCIPGRVLAECAPAPSRSLQLWVPWSLLHRQLLPKGSRSFLGTQPPVMMVAPAPANLAGLASRFSVLIECLSSVNTQWMTTDLGVNEKSRSALFCKEGEVFGGCAATSQASTVSSRSSASPGEGTHGNILASASSGEISPGEKCKRKAAAGIPKSHQMQLQSQHIVK